MKIAHIIAVLLVVIGALNWGLVGLFGYNAVSTLVGPLGLEQIVYILVGVSGAYLLVTHKGDCKVCSDGKKK